MGVVLIHGTCHCILLHVGKGANNVDCHTQKAKLTDEVTPYIECFVVALEHGEENFFPSFVMEAIPSLDVLVVMELLGQFVDVAFACFHFRGRRSERIRCIGGNLIVLLWPDGGRTLFCLVEIDIFEKLVGSSLSAIDRSVYLLRRW